MSTKLPFWKSKDPSMLKLIKTTIAFIYLAIVSLLYLPLAFIFPFHRNHVHYIGKFLGPGHYLLGIKLEILNKELIDGHPPCVFISNHQDNIDVFFGAATTPKSTVTIGKKIIIWFPFFGLMYYFTGNILINRKNKKSAFGTMDQAANVIKEKGISVWIMPEGTRSKGRGLLPFKKGAFITAIKAQVPIYPIAISEYHKTLDLKKLYAGKVVVKGLAPIETKGLTVEDADKLRETCQNAIKNALIEINQLALNS